MKARQWVVKQRPSQRELKEHDFALEEVVLREPQAGEVLLRVLYLAFEPAIKGWMESTAHSSIGQAVFAVGLAQVMSSASDQFEPGDLVVGPLGWQDYAVVRAAGLERVERDELLTANLGVFNSAGLTAYFGLQKIGQPFPGDTVVVTSAAGATGSVAGQIAKIAGCKVIGVAGGAVKCAWLTQELGFDAAIDYKTEDLRSAIERHAPRGIDVIWDNVGGPQLDTLLESIAMHARVVLCGGIWRYEKNTPTGPANYFNLIRRQARMGGFIVGNFATEYPAARARLRAWVREGRLKYRDDIQSGLENGPRTLMRLFTGANFGKQLLKIADPQ